MTRLNGFILYNSRKDFYLISQRTNQGSVNPTHYHIIEGQGNLPLDRLETLTYKLTHMYYNWSVSKYFKQLWRRK